MSDTKPKRVLTDEMKAKMLEGRKKANEKRKALKEAEKRLKEEKKEEKAQTKIRKEQAVEQQTREVENLKQAKIEKEKVKARLQVLKNDIMDEAVPDIDPEDGVTYEPSDEADIEMTEEDMMDIVNELTPEEYERLFMKHARKVEKHMPTKETKKLFKDAVKSKFDFNLDLEENIQGMIDYVNHHVAVNTLAAKLIRDQQKEKEEKKLKEEQVVEKAPEVARVEQQIDSNINMLFRLR
jgi:hypothetical protein